MNHNLVGEKSQDPKLLDVSNSGEYFISKIVSAVSSSQIHPNKTWSMAASCATVHGPPDWSFPRQTMDITNIFWFKISLCCVLVMYLLQM